MTARFIPLLLLNLLAVPLLAQVDTTRGVRIGLTYQAGLRPGLAVLPVAGGEVGDSVRAIIQRDLDFGDRVTIVGTFASDLPPVSGVPNFDLFGKMGVNGIVQATVTPAGVLHVALYDVGRKVVAGTADIPLPPVALSSDWRMAVHAASDEVERLATGVRGIAATRIAFVRERRLWLVDSDGANPTPVGGENGLSPAWHPSGRYLAYSVFAEPGGEVAGSQIGIRDLATGTSRRLTATKSGSNITPAFSPDGSTLVYSYGDDQGSDIYSVDAFQGGSRRRITVGRGSENASPSFSPDGRQLAFVSGRIGRPEVYISDVDGSNVAELYETNPDRLGEYVRSDVAVTKALHRKWRGLFCQ